MGSFVYLVPFAVSAVTSYVAEREKRRTLGYHTMAGMLANVFFVIGTLLIMIEGLICAIVIVPLFAVIGAVSGLVIGAVCRWTNWPKQVVGCVAVLPLVVGGLEHVQTPEQRVQTIERSLTIAAPRQVVWAQLSGVRDIRPEEIKGTVAFLIGVPPPVSATTLGQAGHRVRRIAMGKHVYFDQEEVERREFEFIRWNQRFYPDSFPPGSFDQHVVMGGDYFDVNSVSYSLADDGAGTRLTLSMDYRVSTRFDWYADAVAKLVLGNLEKTLLRVYEDRAVATVGKDSRGLERRI